MKFKNILFVCLFTVLLVACNHDDQTIHSDDFNNIKDLVHEYSVRNITDQSASITSKQLIITDSDGRESTYELPNDEFFVSIAPFINETHPCMDHSLTGCQGELVEEEFDIYIEDAEGKVMIDETIASLENGFIDLWLPRDNNYRIIIDHDGKRVESEFSTFDHDGTCLTNMQLT